jgi:small-conductance mechanosensitive channel
MVLTNIPKAPHFEDRSSLVLEELIKIKKVNNKKELKEKVEKLEIKLSKSKRDKTTLEIIVLEVNERNEFLDEQVQYRDTRITILELQLSKKKRLQEKNLRKRKGEVGLN